MVGKMLGGVVSSGLVWNMMVLAEQKPKKTSLLAIESDSELEAELGDNPTQEDQDRRNCSKKLKTNGSGYEDRTGSTDEKPWYGTLDTKFKTAADWAAPSALIAASTKTCILWSDRANAATIKTNTQSFRGNEFQCNVNRVGSPPTTTTGYKICKSGCDPMVCRSCASTYCGANQKKARCRIYHKSPTENLKLIGCFEEGFNTGKANSGTAGSEKGYRVDTPIGTTGAGNTAGQPDAGCFDTNVVLPTAQFAYLKGKKRGHSGHSD